MYGVQWRVRWAVAEGNVLSFIRQVCAETCCRLFGHVVHTFDIETTSGTHEVQICARCYENVNETFIGY